MDKDLNNGQPTTIGKAVKAYCLEMCCTGQRKEVEFCTMPKTCPLYNFRDGKSPFKKKRVMTEEQKTAAVARLAAARGAKS